MRFATHLGAAALVLAGAGAGSLTPTPAAAQAFSCSGFADEMVKLDRQARALRCSGWSGSSDWSMHRNRCLAEGEARTRRTLESWRATYGICAASGPGGAIGGWPGGGGVRPPVVTRPAAPCEGVSGLYQGGMTVNVAKDGRAVQVMVSPRRPLAFGTCRGNRLTVNFTDDRVISGVYDGRAIFWDNRTTWVKR